MNLFPICLAAFIIALSCLINVYLPFILILGLIYLWILIKYPEIALVFSILVFISFFSMISEDFMRLPYVFRLRDIFLITIFLPFLIGVGSKSPYVRYVLSSPMTKVIYLLLSMTIAQLIITKLRFPEESIGSMVRMGRRYFYYALYFPALYILLDDERRRRFAKISLWLACLFCLMFICQFLAGPGHKIFRQAIVVYQRLQGFRVTRVYTDGNAVATIVFHLIFMRYLFVTKTGNKLREIFLIVLTGIQALLTFSRAHIFGIFVGTLFGILSARWQPRLKRLVQIVTVILVLIVGAEFAFKLFMPNRQDILQVISTRIISTAAAISNKSDTVGFRIKDNMGRLGIIKDNPFFGIGFIHDESTLFVRERGFNKMIRTSDCGLITLLIDFGVVGVLWLLLMSLIFFRSCFDIYRISKTQEDKALILGFLSFYFGRFISFITLADYVFIDGIVVITLCLAFIETVRYKSLIPSDA